MNAPVRRAAAACLAVLLAFSSSATASAAPTEPINPDDCKRALGASAPTSTWALDRLQLARSNSITQGRRVDNGVPVTVAVVDGGIDPTHPQLKNVDVATLRNALRDDPGRKILDCKGHGTQVTAIIAAQPSSAGDEFVGVAPDVRIVPVKITNGESVAPADVARGIDLARESGAQIANLSLALKVDDTQVRAAVARAQRAGMLIVAAAGNDGNDANRFALYPAAYATKYDNVLGVGAITAENVVANYSGSGPYVGVVAPGDAVQTVGVAGGYLLQTGTSFAAPYVSGIAALALAAHPGMKAAELRNRIEATADAPPATVPDTRWGYGTVDPYLAVTSVRGNVPISAPTSPRPQPIAIGPAVVEPDRTLQDVALSVALGLLGLTAAVIVGAAVLRGRRRVTRVTTPVG